MDPTPRHLRKPDVEALLDAISGPASSALEEIAVVRHALGPALARVLGRERDVTWAMLIDAAARRGHWTALRTQLLLAADAPQDMPDVEAVLDALWHLVTELNELRTIGPDRSA
ncbi:unannotated protein [freshwater metagenome]|uniref:Unannotated protein n=1 Tax=freshwater metagenome TaxID=449393 RepID=A0A6J6SXE4_9ZZZZ|nr:hypothetical protein [Actinomycetota bacterium]MSY71380.1 hypothetical protein [Actinomycetota bacterium]